MTFTLIFGRLYSNHRILSSSSYSVLVDALSTSISKLNDSRLYKKQSPFKLFHSFTFFQTHYTRVQFCLLFHLNGIRINFWNWKQKNIHSFNQTFNFYNYKIVMLLTISFELLMFQNHLLRILFSENKIRRI